MEFNLSDLLEKKQVTIKIGDSAFEGTISAYVIDMVQDVTTNKISKTLSAKKIKLGNNVDVNKVLKSIDFDLGEMIRLQSEDYEGVVKAFFGEETYAEYAKCVETIGLALVNKRIFSTISEEIQRDMENKKDDSSKNE